MRPCLELAFVCNSQNPSVSKVVLSSHLADLSSETVRVAGGGGLYLSIYLHTHTHKHALARTLSFLLPFMLSLHNVTKLTTDIVKSASLCRSKREIIFTLILTHTHTHTQPHTHTHTHAFCLSLVSVYADSAQLDTVVKPHVSLSQQNAKEPSRNKVPRPTLR